VRNQAGVTLPPGHYQARIKLGAEVQTQAFNVVIDPRIAADGVTQADLEEQFEHNMRMREMVSSVNELVRRVREGKTKVQSDLHGVVTIIEGKLVTEPVRYGKPGLQAQITYLASMTANVDQKIGRDAIERYQVLKQQLDELRKQVDLLLPVTKTTDGAQQQPQ
jgi:hypothetical protein